MKLSVHLVTWNGAKYVPYLFDSLRKQTYRDWSLYILDNNSSDGIVEVMKNELNNFIVQYQLWENKENIGFAGGHNRLYKETHSDYLLLLNQDMYLLPDCLEKMVQFLEEHEEVAVVSPRLMRWEFGVLTQIDETLWQKSFTDFVDSLGLRVFRNRRVVEWMTQQSWASEEVQKLINKLSNNQSIHVFGVSGALPMFRRRALNDVAYPDGTFFDESYHSYKEDVDLAFRLRSRGWKAFVLLDVAAYHDRSGAGPKDLGDAAALKNKEKQSERVRYHSYKNHLMTLYKNEYWPNFLLDFPWILWYELKKFVYFLLFDRPVLVGLKEIWLLCHSLRERRKYHLKLRRVGWREMRGWWTNHVTRNT